MLKQALIILNVVLTERILSFTGVTCQRYGVGKPKYLGVEGDKSDKCMGVSQLLGARARAAPQSLRLCRRYFKRSKSSITSSVFTFLASSWLCHLILIHSTISHFFLQIQGD